MCIWGVLVSGFVHCNMRSGAAPIVALRGARGGCDLEAGYTRSNRRYTNVENAPEKWLEDRE